MSYRCCAKCDCIINNRIHQEWNCPECDSDEMLSPLDDDRDWDKLYKDRREKWMNDVKKINRSEIT